MSRHSSSKVVVVTGASSGIGRGAAIAFASRGDDVVLAARSQRGLDEVVAECRGAGARAVAVPTDVSDEGAVHRLAERAIEEFGRIDVWVNAAAVWSYGRFEDTPAAAFRQIVETTLFGQVHAARALLPHFRMQQSGVLVNVGSLYGLLTTPYVSPYVTAKWGLLGFSDVLRQELRDAPGIHVCTVLPGAIDTPIYRHAANYLGRDIRPLPPVTSPHRVVEAIVRGADRPRPRIVVGRAHRVGAWAYRATPSRMHDRVVGPVTRLGAVQRSTVDRHDGNVFVTDPQDNGVDDGWRARDRRTIRRLWLVAGAAAVTAARLARR